MLAEVLLPPRGHCPACWSSVYDHITSFLGPGCPISCAVAWTEWSWYVCAAWLGSKAGDSCWCELSLPCLQASEHRCTRHKWSLKLFSSSICPSFLPSSQGALSPLHGVPELGCLDTVSCTKITQKQFGLKFIKSTYSIVPWVWVLRTDDNCVSLTFINISYFLLTSLVVCEYYTKVTGGYR